MRIALFTTFRADKKEQLAALLKRIHEQFVESGLDEPVVTFTFSDAPVPGFTSSVERALKRFPQLHWFRSSGPLLPKANPVPQISNGPASPAAGRTLDFATLLEVARGVPRSLPFHGVMVHFHSQAFGDLLPMSLPAPAKTPGIIVGDSWWINGRNRSLMALTLVEGDPGAKNLPAPPTSVAKILAACGKVHETVQLPLPGLDTAANAVQAAQPDPGVAQRVTEIMRDYRARLTEIINQAGLPHELPSPMEALKQTSLGMTSGPKKPALDRAFKPLGYACRGQSGAFTLRRRTPGNLTVEISLDVGTWSNSLTGFFEVRGVGFTARLPLPPAQSAIGGIQYQIGDAERWQKIVDNLAALVKEFDRTFVPAVEAASGPAPAWYRPES